LVLREGSGVEVAGSGGREVEDVERPPQAALGAVREGDEALPG